MTQTAYIDNLCQHNNLSDNSINTPKSTYCSDYPINLVLSEEYDEITQKRYTTQLQTIVGSLNWLSVSTCPDIVTTNSPIAKYCHNPSKGHIDAALCIVKYIKGTKYMKIKFSSQNNTNLQSFINFTLPPHFHKTNSFVSVMPTGAHRTSHTPPCNLLHQNLNCSKLDQCQVLSCGYIGPLCGSINNKHLQLEAQPKLRSTPLMSVQRTFYTS